MVGRGRPQPNSLARSFCELRVDGVYGGAKGTGRFAKKLKACNGVLVFVCFGRWEGISHLTRQLCRSIIVWQTQRFVHGRTWAQQAGWVVSWLLSDGFTPCEEREGRFRINDNGFNGGSTSFISERPLGSRSLKAASGGIKNCSCYFSYTVWSVLGTYDHSVESEDRCMNMILF